MTAEPATGSESVNEETGLTPTDQRAAGPLARFTRGGEEGQEAAKADSSASSETAGPPVQRQAASSESFTRPASAPTTSAPAAPQQLPRGFRPRGGGDRPKSRREKERDEDKQLERELASERGRDDASSPHVPVPNRRQRSEELEAEVEAALSGVSLDEIVKGDLKTDANRLENGTQHRAQVVDLHADDVFFSLGGKNQGLASVRNFAEPPKPGDMIDVIVTGYSSEDNLYLLSVPGGGIVAASWTDIAEGSMVEARITGANTGGLECEVGNIRGFIPVSQISMHRTENAADYVGQKLVCIVTESNERRGNLVLSRRAVLEREREESKKAILAELEPGQMREGTVRKIHDFGAFVDMGGVDGLIHVSQLAWERVKHPSEVVQEGQKVRVRVERIDEATGKISLSLKNPEEHPWTNIEQRFPVGATVKGPVSRIAQFGAFVKLAPGVEGLIHISELAHHKVFKVENVVKEGEEVECKVLDVDAEAQRMSLSLKAAIAKPEKVGEAGKEKVEVDEPPRELAVPKRSGPLKGGIKRRGGGEQFGLKW
jgi:small subunit ribosomal protein S1